MENKITRLKKRRNWLLTVIIILALLNLLYCGLKYSKDIPSDEEVVRAAIEVDYMGLAYALEWEDSGIDRNLVIDMAREDPGVQEQIKKNRDK